MTFSHARIKRSSLLLSIVADTTIQYLDEDLTVSDQDEDIYF